jgi:surface protein
MGNTLTNFSSINGVSVTKMSSRNGQSFPEPFSFTIDTTLGDGLAQFTLPLQNRTLNAGTNITVDWGDGNYDDITSYNDAVATHSYTSGGTYDIRIWGICGWQFNLQTSSAPKMTVMTSYGDGGVTVSNFDGCGNLVWATDAFPSNFSSIDYGPFTGCTLFNPDTSGWNIGFAYNLGRSAFQGLSSFDADISSWNLKNLSNTSSFLSGCSSQNSDVSSWHTRWMTGFYFDTSTPSVGSTFLQSFFVGCSSFNCSDDPGVAGTRLRVWEIPNGATNMAGMFSSCTVFNQELDTHIENPGGPNEYTAWDVSAITSMANMFSGVRNFDRDLGSWDTGNVTTMFAMFANSTFEGGPNKTVGTGLDLWDVSSCVSFARMFFDPVNQFAAFNGYIGSWTLKPGVTNIDVDIMFRNNKTFNQDIGGWTNTSSIGNTFRMFQSATAFNNGGVGGLNQGMDQWDVSNMSAASMFDGASSFDQYLGSWDVSNWTSMANILNSTSMSHDCSEWTTTNIQNFSSAFKSSRVNFNFGEWQMDSATNLSDLASMNSAHLSDANVALSLIGWSSSAGTNTGVDASRWCSISSLPRTMSQTATETTVSTGTNTTPLTTFKLVDSTADFVSDGVAAGDIVRNTTSGKLCSVVSVDDLTTLTIGLNIFTSAGDSYTITSGFDGAAAKSAFDNLELSTGSGGKGWTMTGTITWV